MPAYFTSWLFWKRWDRSESQAREDRAASLQRESKARDESLQRERELSDRLGPLLASSAEILAQTPARFERALGQAQGASRQSEVDTLVRRLGAEVTRLTQERPD